MKAQIIVYVDGVAYEAAEYDMSRENLTGEALRAAAGAAVQEAIIEAVEDADLSGENDGEAALDDFVGAVDGFGDEEDANEYLGSALMTGADHRGELFFD